MQEKTHGGRGKWILLAAVLALAAGAYFFFKFNGADPLKFNTVAAANGDLASTVTATGILNPVKSVQVGCQVSGTIREIYVDFNSQVKAGDPIAQIDQRVYLAQVAQAEADLSNAMANMELQKAQNKRAVELFSNKLISESDYDISTATLHQAEAAVKIKQASLENAKANLGFTKITSPVDGVVILRAVDVGQTVAASFNTPTLFQIANDLTKMQIDAAVSEADVGGISEGQPVEFTVDAYPNRTFHGTVVQVRNSPTTLNNVVTYDAVIGVTNSDYKLKPGMTASVSVITAQRTNALKAPNAALRFRPPDGATVLTNELASATQTNVAPSGRGSGSGGGGSKMRIPRNIRTVYFLTGTEQAPVLRAAHVKTGITDGFFTEILDGLKEGDKIVSGVVNNDPREAASGSGSNPFGGGGMRRMR